MRIGDPPENIDRGKNNDRQSGAKSCQGNSDGGGQRTIQSPHCRFYIRVRAISAVEGILSR